MAKRGLNMARGKGTPTAPKLGLVSAKEPGSMLVSEGLNVAGPQLEQQWVFWHPNIKRIVKAVTAPQDLVLGLVYAPNDPSAQLFIATIKLHPHVRSMLHLQDCLSGETRIEGARRMRPVGGFVGGDNKICPLDAITQFMADGRRIGAHHCVLCDRRTQEITVWTLVQRPSPRTDIPQLQRIPYTIIGTQGTS